MEPKSEVRDLARKFRHNLTVEQIKQASSIVCEGLKQLTDWDGVESLHCYKAINNELDPAGFIEWLREKYDTTVHIQDLSGEFPEEKFDVAIVPGLTFDRRGSRIGHGKGHYDRFLAEQDKALKIGLCYDALVQEKLPQEPHDVAVNLIVTEKELYN